MKRILIGGFLLLCLLLVPVACGRGGANDDPVVARVNGQDILASDVRIHLIHADNVLAWDFFMMTGSQQMDFDAPHPIHGTFGAAVIEEALQSALFFVAFVDMAEEFGVEIEYTQRQILAQDINQFIAEHGDDAFYDFLQAGGFRNREDFIEDRIATALRMDRTLIEELGEEEFNTILTEDGYRDYEHFNKIMSASFLLDGLIFVLLEDEANFAQFAHLMPPEEVLPHLYGAMHILGHFDEFETEEDAFNYVYELLQRVHAGEDFWDLTLEYSHDHGVWDFPFGYTFAANEMHYPFEALTRELAIGEVGGPVATPFGYHIIMRIEPDPNDWFRLHQRNPQTLEERQIEAIFLAIQERMDSADVERLAALHEIDLEAFFYNTIDF